MFSSQQILGMRKVTPYMWKCTSLETGIAWHLQASFKVLYIRYTVVAAANNSTITTAVKLTSISEVEILGAGGGNAKSDNISSGRIICTMSQKKEKYFTTVTFRVANKFP